MNFWFERRVLGSVFFYFEEEEEISKEEYEKETQNA